MLILKKSILFRKAYFKLDFHSNNNENLNFEILNLLVFYIIEYHKEKSIYYLILSFLKGESLGVPLFLIYSNYFLDILERYPSFVIADTSIEELKEEIKKELVQNISGTAYKTTLIVSKNGNNFYLNKENIIFNYKRVQFSVFNNYKNKNNFVLAMYGNQMVSLKRDFDYEKKSLNILEKLLNKQNSFIELEEIVNKNNIEIKVLYSDDKNIRDYDKYNRHYYNSKVVHYIIILNKKKLEDEEYINSNQDIIDTIIKNKDNINNDSNFFPLTNNKSLFISKNTIFDINTLLLFKSGGNIKEIKDFLDFKRKLEEIDLKNITDYKDSLKEKNFTGSLRDHQIYGFNFIVTLYKNNISGCILADDPGMGKTIQSIAFLTYVFNPSKKYLIAVPVSVVESWKEEIRKFSPLLLPYIENKTIEITSIESVYLKFEDVYKKIEYDVIIVDEAQKLKNRNTIGHSAYRKFNRKFLLALSGTPIENRTEDLVNIINLVVPEIYNGLKASLSKIKRNSEKESILFMKNSIDKIILSRKMDKKNLDKKIISFDIPVFLTKEEKKIYDNIANSIRENKYGYESITNDDFYKNQLIILKRLMQSTSNYNILPEQYKENIKETTPSKVYSTIHLLREIKKRNEKTIIFFINTGSLMYLKNKLIETKEYTSEEIVYIDGSISEMERGRIIKNFQENPNIKIFLASLKAVNFGVTLTKANNVIFYDLWWNPAILKQAIARAYRIGQEKDVNVYFLIAKKTIDEKIKEIIEQKKVLINVYEDNFIETDSKDENKKSTSKILNSI